MSLVQDLSHFPKNSKKKSKTRIITPFFTGDGRETLRYSFDYENKIKYQDDENKWHEGTLIERLHCTWDSKRAEKDKISKDESWDGFYGIQCSKIKLSTDDVLNAYRRLWKIEESFRILKSSLQSRPVFHWSEKRIRGHLVICFIAFLLQRILELRLIECGYEHTPDRIRKAVQDLELSVVKVGEQTMYLRSSIPELSANILRALHIPKPKSLSLPQDF